MTNTMRQAVAETTPLIAALLRSHYAPLNEAQLVQTATGIDANKWEQAIHFHGLAGLIARRHAATIATLLGPEFSERADFLATRQTRHGLTQAATLKSILDQFTEAAIPVIPLKGQALSLRLYGELGLRAPGDVDILVDPQDLPQAIRTLQAHGWQFNSPFAPDITPALMMQHHHCSFTKGNDIVLELHWRSTASPLQALPDLRSITDQLIARSGGGLTYLDLPDPLLARLVLTHSARTLCGRLKWAVDTLDLVPIIDLDNMDPVTRSAAATALTVCAHALDLPEQYKLGLISKTLNIRAHKDEMMRLSQPGTSILAIANLQRGTIRFLATMFQHPPATRIRFAGQAVLSLILRRR
ncbi:MAG: nucleotidyltransferase family protein [Alphaproteobacteria bacterium]